VNGDWQVKGNGQTSEAESGSQSKLPRSTKEVSSSEKRRRSKRKVSKERTTRPVLNIGDRVGMTDG